MNAFLRQSLKEAQEGLAALRDTVAKQSRKFRVLVVENDKNDEELCRAQWEKFADYCEVDVARNGHSALEMLKANKYDLMLLDMKLNGFSGLDVLRECAEQALNVKTIVLTGTYTDGSPECDRACELGAIFVMRKPITAEQVVTILARP